MAKISRPVLYTVVVGVIAYAWVVLTEPDAAAPHAVKARTAAASTGKTTEYVPEDYQAHFASLNQPVKNAFKPLIIRKNAMMSSDSSQRNGIPAKFANGDPNWAYTGLVEVNGERMALLENSKTGEGEYLRRGDHWRGSLIKSIGDDALVIVAADGMVRSIQLGAADKEPEPETATETEVVPVQPTVSPALQGDIGMNITNTPGAPVSKRG